MMSAALRNAGDFSPQRASGRRLLSIELSLLIGLALVGCDSSSTEDRRGSGPGGRHQDLVLSPKQERELGERAYREVLSSSTVLTSGPDVERVRRVGKRIAQAVEIEPLQREINLLTRGFTFEWEFNVLRDQHINAVCLPGGKVAVFTGLFSVVTTDAQLAAVLAHEIAHALAHHTSERLARQASEGGGLFDVLVDKAHDRDQESEADHIGLFLMTFAGYEPEEAVILWERMQTESSGSLQLPEFLSDHPSDRRRITQMASWIAPAKAAKRAYDEGRVLPRSGK